MLKNKSVVKIVSVILAIGLWAYVIGEVNPTVKKTVADIPVQLTNVESLSERGLALSEYGDYYTAVVIKGSRAELNSMKASDIHAVADMYGYTKGENHVSVDVTVPDGIYIEEIKIPEITVILEKQVSEHFPLQVEFTGAAGENLEPTFASTVPEEVEVKGAASVIEKVDAVYARLDCADLTETWDVYTETPVACNAKGNQINNVYISAQTVEIEAVMHHTKSVPLELKVTGRPEGSGANVTVPEKVTVKGNTYALEKVDSVTADEVDISSVNKDTDIPVKVDLPSGVYLADSAKDIVVKIEYK